MKNGKRNEYWLVSFIRKDTNDGCVYPFGCLDRTIYRDSETAWNNILRSMAEIGRESKDFVTAVDKFTGVCSATLNDVHREFIWKLEQVEIA